MALQSYNLARFPSSETPHFLVVEASTRITTRYPNSSKLLSFSSSFTFSITPYNNSPPGRGFAFILVPSLGIEGASWHRHLGFLNSTNDGYPNNHVFDIVFDVFKNQEFNDINDKHVMNAHSLLWLPRKPDIGLVQRTIKYWSCAKNDQSKTNWSFQELSVTMAPSHTHTVRPLINVPLDLSKVFLDEMYVGFCASTGNLIENHKTLRGTFFQELTFNGICSSHYVNLVFI